jgi:hypothetical protein
MRPLKKGETLIEYGKAATRDLTKRAARALEARGKDSAWEVIFKEICAQGEWMQKGSPAAFVIYQLSVANALTFLHTFPCARKAQQLTDQVISDLHACGDFLLLMKDDNFSPAEFAAIHAATLEVNVNVQELIDHFKNIVQK